MFFMVFLGVPLGALLFWAFYSVRFGSFHQHALLIIRQAELEATQKKAGHSLELQQIQQHIQHDQFRLKSEEQRLKSQEQQLHREIDRHKKDQAKFASLQKIVDEKGKALDEERRAVAKTLEHVANLSLDEARRILFEKAREAFQGDVEREKISLQRCFEHECKARAQNLLLSAIERKSQELTKESFLTEIPLKNRALIPRIIGKEGRNIQTLEEILQVAIIIEEHVPRLLISAHEKKQRLIAKATIERLFIDEKVTPFTIRAAYEEAVATFSLRNKERGEEAIRSCGGLNNISPDVCETVGSLEFRSSIGQNVLAHSIEVACLMGILAGELGLKIPTAKAMGLFHDIGKGLSPSWGDSHALAGKSFLEKWGIDKEIADAVAAHHGEEPITSAEAQLLPICDRISAQLPGVRNPETPAFLSMVHRCEETTKKLPNVLSSWAHYAGSHIELLVRHAALSQPDVLLKSVHEALSTVDLPIPVKVTLLNPL